MDAARSCRGIDVSHFQGAVDWQKVAASGIGFVCIKALDGLSNPDPKFVVNWAGAKGAGLLRFPYHFFRPYSDAVSQAQAFYKLWQADPGELPSMVDIEEAPVTGEPDTWTRIVKPSDRLAKVIAFVNETVRLGGRAPVIYSRAGYWKTMFVDGSPLAQMGCPWWPAEYHPGVAVDALPAAPKIAPGWTDWAFWQYSQGGTCSGVSGNVDVDVFNGDLAALKAFAANNPAVSAPLAVA